MIKICLDFKSFQIWIQSFYFIFDSGFKIWDVTKRSGLAEEKSACVRQSLLPERLIKFVQV